MCNFSDDVFSSRFRRWNRFRCYCILAHISSYIDMVSSDDRKSERRSILFSPTRAVHLYIHQPALLFLYFSKIILPVYHHRQGNFHAMADANNTKNNKLSSSSSKSMASSTSSASFYHTAPEYSQNNQQRTSTSSYAASKGRATSSTTPISYPKYPRQPSQTPQKRKAKEPSTGLSVSLPNGVGAYSNLNVGASSSNNGGGASSFSSRGGASSSNPIATVPQPQPQSQATQQQQTPPRPPRPHYMLSPDPNAKPWW